MKSKVKQHKSISNLSLTKQPLAKADLSKLVFTKMTSAVCIPASNAKQFYTNGFGVSVIAANTPTTTTPYEVILLRGILEAHKPVRNNLTLAAILGDNIGIIDTASKDGYSSSIVARCYLASIVELISYMKAVADLPDVRIASASSSIEGKS